MVSWKSPNDLRNAANNLNEKLEEKSRARGEDAANRLIEATRNYGGLWFFLRFPSSVIAGGLGGSAIFAALGIENAFINLGALVIGTWIWYVGRPLQVHPFVEMGLAVVGLGLLLGGLAELGISV